MTREAASSFSYCVFSFVIDDARAITIPVGVALWSPERRLVKVRLLKEKERLKGFDQEQHFPFVRLAHDKVAHWIGTGDLPFLKEHLSPYDDRWWRHVRNLLIHRVRLSEPRPIDCRDPDEELDPLFDSVVAPHRPSADQRRRIDGEIRKCLNGIAEKFKTRQPLRGYGDRPVTVLRSYRGPRGWVVIEGVNLATPQAESQADATVSKLLRLQEGLQETPQQVSCHLMLGYLASPEGLNGETVLVDWIRHKTGAKTFDLIAERQVFRAAAGQLVADVDAQGTLFEQE